jgi:hypothetical protein
MAITQDAMDELARSVLIPVMLVLDAWMFQYLVTVYYPRRRELRVRLLLLASFLGFATQVYSHESREMALLLNDISETSLQLTFLIQITLIGRAVSKKVKVATILWFTNTAELLVVLGWLNVLGTVLEVSDVLPGAVLHALGNVLEAVSLVFILVFRFYYLSTTSSFRIVLQERKLEIVLYVLFVVHEYPFMLLEHYTDITWEFVQGIFNRLTLVACIVQNIRQKALSSATSSRNSTVRSRKYSIASVPSRLASLTSQAPIFNRTGSLLAKTGSLRSVKASPDIAKIAVASTNTTEQWSASTN